MIGDSIRLGEVLSADLVGLMLLRLADKERLCT